MSFVIVDALEEALVLAKYGQARRVSEDVDRAVAAWCFVKFLQWVDDEAWADAITDMSGQLAGWLPGEPAGLTSDTVRDYVVDVTLCTHVCEGRLCSYFLPSCKRYRNPGRWSI